MAPNKHDVKYIEWTYKSAISQYDPLQFKQRVNDTKPLPSHFPPAKRYKQALLGTSLTPGNFGDGIDLEQIFNMYDGCLPTAIDIALKEFLKKSESAGGSMQKQWDQEKNEAETLLYRRLSAVPSPSLDPSDLFEKLSIEPVAMGNQRQSTTPQAGLVGTGVRQADLSNQVATNARRHPAKFHEGQMPRYPENPCPNFEGHPTMNPQNGNNLPVGDFGGFGQQGQLNSRFQGLGPQGGMATEPQGIESFVGPSNLAHSQQQAPRPMAQSWQNQIFAQANLNPYL
ncbi:hypothetical protein BJ875DRAFT_50740 [Amylocarpus encephaloides]|uniref:Uncharacterized protein n=1 Tax=Amylocarpus encephaloides TaxID=45428 RepID=A0A9P7YGX4_9HELO|nr:hypothetical protein BJ875DRAFT_50740 [Amylocarpus encephaloides]